MERKKQGSGPNTSSVESHETGLVVRGGRLFLHAPPGDGGSPPRSVHTRDNLARRNHSRLKKPQPGNCESSGSARLDCRGAYSCGNGLYRGGTDEGIAVFRARQPGLRDVPRGSPLSCIIVLRTAHLLGTDGRQAITLWTEASPGRRVGRHTPPTLSARVADTARQIVFGVSSYSMTARCVCECGSSGGSAVRNRLTQRVFLLFSFCSHVLVPFSGHFWPRRRAIDPLRQRSRMMF